MRLTRVHSDDRGSLLMVLMVITIGLGLSAVLTPLVVRQIKATRISDDRITALNAAQAGLDMVMARVRAAAALATDVSGNTTITGLLENLPPCAFEGDAGVDGVGESMKYSVSIVYRNEDGNVLGCDPNRPDQGPTKVPATAELSVTGLGGPADRVLTATYVFTTSNNNIPGGQIRISSHPIAVVGDQCIDAGPVESPAAGAGVTMRACNGSSGQQFAYGPELYLKLVNSESALAEYGMCLNAGTSHSSSSIVVFQPCPATTKPASLFQWSLDGASQFHSTKVKSKDANGNDVPEVESLCMTVKTPTITGGKIGLGSCSGDGNTTIWRSATGVGAGMAGDSTNQMVNYSQFSRCLDVTNKDTGMSYMIAWFCKQSPDGTVEWNQRWYHPVPVLPAIFKAGNISITKDLNPTSNSVWYCLRSPESAASNVYVTLVLCKGNESNSNTRWTVYHNTGDYATSYRVRDSKGYCLTPTDLTATPKDTHSDGTSKVKVAVCNSSELQKWNAPANLIKPTPLVDLNEE